MAAKDTVDLKLLPSSASDSEQPDAEAPVLLDAAPRSFCFAKRAVLASAALVSAVLAVSTVGLGSRAAPKLVETSAPVAKTITGLQEEEEELTCQDTPDWTNYYTACKSNGFTESQGCLDEGVTCFGYQNFGWCSNGAPAPGKDWTMGEKFNNPELNCCACGKESTPISRVADGTQGEPSNAACAASACKGVGLTEGNCCPNDDGVMLSCCGGETLGTARAVLPPAATPGPKMTFYMFRSEGGAADYKINGANFANLPGTMWYLHNEVVQACPRKFNIDRIVRFKVTVRATKELYGQNSANFDSFVAIDKAKCTVPNCTKLHWDPYGYVVGCQPNNVKTVAVPGTPTWYSLPGSCPSKFYFDKTPDCMKDEPGGMCATDDVTGARDCTYYFEQAGSIKLDELSGIKDYNLNCQDNDQMEYNPSTDKGTGTNFWDGKTDPAAGQRRMQQIGDLFNNKFGNPLDLENSYSPECKPL